MYEIIYFLFHWCSTLTLPMLDLTLLIDKEHFNKNHIYHVLYNVMTGKSTFSFSFGITRWLSWWNQSHKNLNRLENTFLIQQIIKMVNPGLKPSSSQPLLSFYIQINVLFTIFNKKGDILLLNTWGLRKALCCPQKVFILALNKVHTNHRGVPNPLQSSQTGREYLSPCVMHQRFIEVIKAEYMWRGNTWKRWGQFKGQTERKAEERKKCEHLKK